MAEPIRPIATPTFGKKNWIFAPAITSPTLAPTVAEATGASTLDFSRIAFANGAPTPTQSTNRVTAEPRYADTIQNENIGLTQYQGGEMIYAFGPQAVAATDPKKLWEKIPEGTTGFLIQRLGIARATAVIAGQFVNVYPVAFGPSLPMEQGDAESAEAAATVTYAITGPPAFNVAVLA